MTNGRYDTKTLWRADHDHQLHPWTHFESFRRTGSRILCEGKGSIVWDTDGKRYLDAAAGLWCVNIGHGRQEMAEAIAAQAMRLAYYSPFVDTTTAPAAELAGKLAALAPGRLNHVFFTTGGSTANDAAVRLIQFYNGRRGRSGKRIILSRVDAYHGSTLLTASISGKPADRVPYFRFLESDVHHLSSPNTYRRADGMSEREFCDFLIEEMRAAIEKLGAENVSCFFAEPILGAGGVHEPPEGYHRRSRELCREYDVLYVSDEVITGFGRLGHVFSSLDVFGIEPDILVTAKGLTSAYQPLGACIYSDAIHEVVEAEDPSGRGTFACGFTYGGHPVACAAALKNIEILEREELCARVRSLSPPFEERLRALTDLPIVGDVRGRGFMRAVELVRDPATKEPFPAAVAIAKRVAWHAADRGLLVRSIGAHVILSPPLVFTAEEIDEATAALRDAIRDTAAEIAV